MSLHLPPLLKSRFGPPVAILGGGVSGEGVQALVAALGGTAKVYDQKGLEFTAKAAAGHGLVVYSPGFPPEHPWLARARAAGAEVLAELDFAALCWGGKVIAVTGTNGKTTLTEFLTHALRTAGRTAVATGNIGHPFTRLVAEVGSGLLPAPGSALQRLTAQHPNRHVTGAARDCYAVCEVSSFQAEGLRHFHADATLWTNFAEDHLERHPGLEAYFSAKWNLITRTAPGAVFAGTTVQRFAARFDRPLPASAAVASEAQPADPRLAGTVFAEYPQRENFLLAAAWWRHAGFDEKTLLAAARTFALGRHRLSRVMEQEGVTYWNDSKATNFHAVEAALASFPHPVVLIAGGKGKGGDLAGFVHRIAPRVKHALLIGEQGAELAFQCSTFRVAHTACASLEEAVRRAAELAEPGEHVLLSPGFASFDQFRNYEDRGDQFERLVRDLRAPANLR
ncbi:MAG TPA: UDP-N-acetylmuramoyl-L-alanine--D-glutamate ligase [Opitutaceae bacterium]|nr:UDP-N-acetylmuramoyl-L-alanine--D-glutamate ligase [Opitutaceae bacterium]